MKKTYCDRCECEILDGNQAVFIHAHLGPLPSDVIEAELCPRCWDDMHDVLNAEPVSG